VQEVWCACPDMDGRRGDWLVAGGKEKKGGRLSARLGESCLSSSKFHEGEGIICPHGGRASARRSGSCGYACFFGRRWESWRIRSVAVWYCRYETENVC
jgi:hypothetical protein